MLRVGPFEVKRQPRLGARQLAADPEPDPLEVIGKSGDKRRQECLIGGGIGLAQSVVRKPFRVAGDPIREPIFVAVGRLGHVRPTPREARRVDSRAVGPARARHLQGAAVRAEPARRVVFAGGGERAGRRESRGSQRRSGRTGAEPAHEAAAIEQCGSIRSSHLASDGFCHGRGFLLARSVGKKCASNDYGSQPRREHKPSGPVLDQLPVRRDRLWKGGREVSPQGRAAVSRNHVRAPRSLRWLPAPSIATPTANPPVSTRKAPRVSLPFSR